METKCKDGKPQMIDTISQIIILTADLFSIALSAAYVLGKAPSRYLLESDWYPCVLILIVSAAFIRTL
jgi:hypothetical protein